MSKKKMGLVWEEVLMGRDYNCQECKKGTRRELCCFSYQGIQISGHEFGGSWPSLVTYGESSRKRLNPVGSVYIKTRDLRGY